jgi:acyl-CoA thioester hydrolase
MAEFMITYRGIVYPWQCDHMGHMNVMWFVGKFDEASWQMLSRLGLSPSRLKQEHAGMAAVDQHNQYKREIHAGDPITVRSAVVGMGMSSIRMIHEMTDDTTEELAATSNVVGVYMSLSERKRLPLPPDIRERAELLINGGGGDFEAQPVGGSTISLTAAEWNQFLRRE